MTHVMFDALYYAHMLHTENISHVENSGRFSLSCSVKDYMLHVGEPREPSRDHRDYMHMVLFFVRYAFLPARVT